MYSSHPMAGSSPPKNARLRGRRRRGATALELTLVIALLAILVAIAIPGMSPVVQNYRLRGAAWQLAGDLRLARQRAVTIRKRFRICVTTCAITVPAGSYSVERDDGTITKEQWNSETGATVALPQGVSISANTNAATFNQTGMAGGSKFTLRNVMGTYEVKVGSTGRVKVCQGTCPP